MKKPPKKQKKIVEGILDNWSLLQQMNVEHPSFGAIAAFLGKSKWRVKIEIEEEGDGYYR